MSLHVPSTDSPAGPSRHTNGASRPVSVSAHTATAATASGSSRRQRASHTVTTEGGPRSGTATKERGDGAAAYTDVYSHPAAVAYAAAHPKRSIPKFGPYLLLQTLGEGEFGKVKLGLHSQWGEEVAVKLIRRGNIDSAVRMSKVEREIEVLRTLKHPNIVRLYDVIETDKYIGIIIEYASGGELFDHILAHRYLREKDAAKLFSQLISGVWYIHQKKIVHRDLKLENLLLDRNRNVLITDFGFANRFEHRTDDLMQTSCGSPCYAAPELVISEGLYVGSAVDIWSCGVILYAMLAGYLPFDDDPANPDGDNINLLYKYIVNTPLSFPDYISDDARSLLSMMLVPDPSRRASLENVMAHPWLAAWDVPRPDLDGYTRTAFGRTVDDLEDSALEQHQQKRLAYQRQMRAATQPASSSDRMARSQSHRPENGISPSPNTTGASRSQSIQPNLVYETSSDQSPPPVSAPVSSRYDNGLMDGDDPFAAPSGVAPPDETPAKNKRSTRHTVQVEYDGPSRSARKERAAAADVVDGDRERERERRHAAAAAAQETTPRSPEKKRRASNAESTKPLPVQPPPSEIPEPTTPTQASHARERTTSKSTTPKSRPPPVETPSITLASPPETPVVFTTPEGSAAEDKDKESQASSKGSRHNRTPSAVNKFFNGAESHSSSLLSPANDKESAPTTPSSDKKSRRSSLTVMIGRTIKGRKGRTATTPVSAVDASTPVEAPPTSYNEVTTRGRTLDNESGSGGGESAAPGMQASTGKAKSVMHWFRSRSKARDSVDPANATYDEPEEYQQTRERERDRNGSSSTINQRATSVQVPPRSQRTPSSATDASTATPSFVTRFRNSVTVGGGGSGGHGSGGGERRERSVLRIHHGAVDQDMITQKAPAEVMVYVKEVLVGMGIEVQLESEFKYRCIRAKRRRKGPVGDVSVGGGGGGGLAAVNMMGSAASNGVDRRGLPVPSSFTSGGMLRGLLMRRQSSQVSPSPSSSSSSSSHPSSTPSPSGNTSANFEDDSVLLSESGPGEPVFGDATEDVGDEVRFSVELTRISGLSDTFSLDIRRLKGNLRSYKFLYDLIRAKSKLSK